MKTLFLVAALCVTPAIMADTVPSEFMDIMKLASVNKIENLSSNTTVYRVEFCPDQTCDMFAADQSNSAILADYAYLFAVYDESADYYSGTAGKTTSAAQRQSIADAILQHDAKSYGCPAGDQQVKCVMHALFKVGKLKRYSSNADEGTTYTEVDEDGQDIPGGYD